MLLELTLGQGITADMASMRAMQARRLWDQMRNGIRAQAAATCDALAQYNKAYWAFALVAGPEQQQQELHDAFVLQPSTGGFLSALHAGAKSEADIRRLVPAPTAAATLLATCRSRASAPAVALGDIIDRVQNVAPDSCLAADLASMAARDGYQLGALSFMAPLLTDIPEFICWSDSGARIGLIFVLYVPTPLLPSA